MSEHEQRRGRARDGQDDGATGPRPGSPPVRWIEAAAATGATDEPDIERRIGGLLAKLPKPPALTTAAEARVEVRLQAAFRRQTAPWRAWYRRPLVMGWGFGAVLLLLSGAVVAGGGVAMWWTRKSVTGAATTEGGTGSFPAAPRPRARRGPHADVAARDPGPSSPVLSPVPVAQESAPAGQDEPTPTAPRRRRAGGYRKGGGASLLAAAAPARTPQQQPAASATPSVVAESPNVAASPPPVETSAPPPPESSWMRAPEPPPMPAPRPYRALPTDPGGSPAPGPSQLSQEARLLNAAMVRLRQHRDGAGALTALDDYLRRYPRGMLVVEARRARIDALLLLQRKDEALRALNTIDLEPIGRGQELLVIRGELRGRRDCVGAIHDFEAVLGGSAPGPLQERALFGRTVCRQRGGDEQGARADARTYLDRFPDGRFASAARRLTGGAR